MIEKTLQTLKETVRPILPVLVEELNPPATPAQINEIDSLLPFALPEELKRLYSVHDGEANERGLFLGLPFIALSEAFDEWKRFAEYASKDLPNLDKNIASVPPKQIKQDLFNTYYFPISRDGGGNSIAVDLDPDQEGTSGQIINYGSEETTRYVIAPSLDGFLAFCVYQLERDNYVVEGEANDKRFHLKEPNKAHLFDALPQLDLPFRAS